MRRSINTPFFAQGFSMLDGFIPSSGAVQCGWTTGRTALRDAALGGPAVSQNWTILSVAFQAYLRYASDPAVTSYVAFGKFGSIIAGLSMDQALSSEAGSQYLTTVAQLPSDVTLTSVMWDPQIHPMPPTAQVSAGPAVSLSTPANSLAISAVISPPVPLALNPASEPSIGIWMLPSLLGTWGGQPIAIGLDLANAGCTVNFDDGLL